MSVTYTCKSIFILCNLTCSFLNYHNIQLSLLNDTCTCSHVLPPFSQTIFRFYSSFFYKSCSLLLRTKIKGNDIHIFHISCRSLVIGGNFFFFDIMNHMNIIDNEYYRQFIHVTLIFFNVFCRYINR